IYYYENEWHLISGSQSGPRWYGFDFDIIAVQDPADASFFYGNESLSTKFTGEDAIAFNGYSVNDSRFTISSVGILTESEAVAPGNYQVNITIDDIAGNINWTLYGVEVKINPGPCNVYVDNSTNFVWTDCSSSYQMYVNGTPIANASTITLGSGYYNISVLRDDAQNYTNFYDEESLTIPQLTDDCSLYFDKVTPQEYPESFTVYTNCNSAYNLSKDGVPISNATTYSLAAGSY
ncbi:MAG: hypothetical protein ACP5D2_05000, partial [Candidatus Nanoarchaeia archaeon]